MGRQAAVTLTSQWRGKKGGMLEDVLPYKTKSPVKAVINVKAANTSQSWSTWKSW